MAIEAMYAEQLARAQTQQLSRFFGMEVPKPGDCLFEVAEKIRKENLFQAEPFYLPRIQLAEAATFPGLKWPLDPWLYEQIGNKTVDQDADWLPGGWILVDVTERPKYKGGEQTYPDTERFKEILATLREEGQIQIAIEHFHVPEGSRFAIPADAIDGNSAAVAKAVATILGLEIGQITTPSYATFNFIGNRACPKLGKVNTSEWLRNQFGLNERLCSGDFDLGGLSHVHPWQSGGRDDRIGFRLLISFPPQT